MNLGDPELELIDPTPNVHTLFIHFDKVFFWAKLASRAVVRWSKRMYSCAGICSYEGRGGLCDIALSEPLLKLRPRKDLIETLLHEMIHAYLFITNRDRERDGHGPNFQAHMHRINKSAGLNISIYHDFHDEVKLYLTHWWRCNGPCQTRRPYFGVVRRSQNRAPGPNDCWFASHQKTCGGTFMKIKEPEKKTKKTAAEKKANNMGDITKHMNNNNSQTVNNNNIPGDVRRPLTPLVKNVPKTPTVKTKSNGGKTLVVTQKSIPNSPVSKPPLSKPPLVFVGKGQTVDGGRKRTSSGNVAEAVRNIWANKQLPTLPNSPKDKILASSKIAANNVQIQNLETKRPNKHKADAIQTGSPPAKVKKIDDYFKNAATSILKDVYGQDFKLTETDNKIVAKKLNLVDCPICNTKVDSNEVNSHIDECLNRDVIEKLSKDNIEVIDTPGTSSSNGPVNNNLKDIVGVLPPIPPFKMFKEENGDIKPEITATVDLTNIYNVNSTPNARISPVANTTVNSFDQNDVNRVKAVVKKMNYDKHVRKSDNFVVVKEEQKNVDCGFLPSFLDDIGCAIKVPAVKIEPGCSKDIVSALTEQKCPCCGKVINKPVAEHLDECLAFFSDNSTVPEPGASTSFANNTIVIDDDEDDMFDETQTFNATGTKTPCPCCLEMIESADMNSHLDSCLS
ncbi:sprT-like domain-containing protein Spartan [Ostrinia furnacalis]|uniref:sprT-like domain-containing protein Spartan n=1 Tax=Ostrinia furnacalis TaxID=93504 RepID=UPI00103C45B6|nr:sprT-like domain-containing protein Spartan [Ostrinia furnacalis]